MTIALRPIIKIVGRVLTNPQMLEFAKDCNYIMVFTTSEGLNILFATKNVDEKIIFQLYQLLPDFSLLRDGETGKPYLYFQIVKEEVKHGEADRPETS